MSDQDKKSESSAYRGLGRLATSLILASLGIGTSIWLGVYITAHDFNHQVKQEDRAAIYVGAKELPIDKIKITVKKIDCSTVTLADYDSGSILMHVRNNCHERIDYLAWNWKMIAPNGTVIHQGYTNSCPLPDRDEEAECIQKTYVDDDRMSSLVVWSQITP